MTNNNELLPSASAIEVEGNTEKPEYTKAADFLLQNSGHFNERQLERQISDGFLRQIGDLAELRQLDPTSSLRGPDAARSVFADMRQALIARVMGEEKWGDLLPDSIREDVTRILETPRLQQPFAQALRNSYEDALSRAQAKESVVIAEIPVVSVEQSGSKESMRDRSVFKLGERGSLFIEGTEASKPDGYAGLSEDTLQNDTFKGLEVVSLDQYPREIAKHRTSGKEQMAINFNGVALPPDAKVIVIDRGSKNHGMKVLRAGGTIAPETFEKRFNRSIPLSMQLSEEGTLTVDKITRTPMKALMVEGAQMVQDSGEAAARRLVGQEFIPDRSEWEQEVVEDMAEVAVEQVVDEPVANEAPSPWSPEAAEARQSTPTIEQPHMFGLEDNEVRTTVQIAGREVRAIATGWYNDEKGNVQMILGPLNMDDAYLFKGKHVTRPLAAIQGSGNRQATPPIIDRVPSVESGAYDSLLFGDDYVGSVEDAAIRPVVTEEERQNAARRQADADFLANQAYLRNKSGNR